MSSPIKTDSKLLRLVAVQFDELSENYQKLCKRRYLFEKNTLKKS